MLHSVIFWYSVALAILLGLAFWKGRRAAVGLIDSRITECVSKITDARNLRMEALKEYEQAKLADNRSRNMIHDIVSNAASESKQLIQEAEVRRKTGSETRLEAVDFRIKQKMSAHSQAFIRMTVDRSLEIAESDLKAHYLKAGDEGRMKKLIEQADRL